jgi:hypothetical protein
MKTVDFSLYLGETRLVEMRLYQGGQPVDLSGAVMKLYLERDDIAMSGSPFSGTPNPSQSGDTKGVASFVVYVPNTVDYEGSWRIRPTANDQTWREVEEWVEVIRP